MSLEATIQENTNAIRELIAAIGNGLHATPAQVAAVVAEAPITKSEKVAVKKLAETTKAAATASADTATTAAATDVQETKVEASEVKAEAATYDQAAKAVTELAKNKGREAAIAVLSQFGAAKLPDVKAEDFAAVIAAAEKAGA